ncbi:hypothetical protein Rhopal_007080-T1 [Rhodotorula paludigena]|uniref:Anp1-domain-containing protein n=1 Tax=Rhodotorula paludigena TaxID=86838 RepID=A0AAV5GXF1_9BASI|nr:hypothetical protein Rhopal_007080-T1 [Rhodotorula paludigena]
MLHAKRRPPPLPTTRFVPASSSPSTYKDKDIRPPSIRVRLQRACAKPTTLVAAFLLVFVGTAWLLGLVGSRGEKVRLGGGLKVVARDWSRGLETAGALGAYNETVLILCPMRNAIEHIWHFFHLVDTLTYPRHLVHLAILVSDSSDRTYARALELADERQYSRSYRGRRYGRISVFQQDFAATGSSDTGAYAGANVGKERHEYDAQIGRRKALGKSRTWLLNSAMAPEVDWALWLDVDLVDYEPTLVERLLEHARAEGPAGGADVVVPNCVWKTYNEMGAYDRNNWIETPDSLAMKANLSSSDVLIEGYKDHPTHRFNLASLVPSDPAASLSSNPYLALSPLPLSSLQHWPPSGLTLPTPLSSATVVPTSLSLDGVGGCAALVRASVHREGAIFPAWPPVDHQLETEGFAQLVKALRRTGGADGEVGPGGRGRLLGLPRYYVYHGLYG